MDILKKWGSSTFLWYFAKFTTPYYMSLDTTQTYLRNAHVQWYDNLNWCGLPDTSVFAMAYGGETGYTFADNGWNTVDFGSMSAIGCAPVTACTRVEHNGDPIIDESDTRMNSSLSWINGQAPNKYDTWSVMAHELGHSLGFGDITILTTMSCGTKARRTASAIKSWDTGMRRATTRSTSRVRLARMWPRIATIGLVVLSVSSLSSCGGDNGAKAGAVEVPTLTGRSVLEASRSLEQSGLSWRFEGSEEIYSRSLRVSSSEQVLPSPAKDRVLAQAPPGRTRVPADTIVVLTTHCSEAMTLGRGCR